MRKRFLIALWVVLFLYIPAYSACTGSGTTWTCTSGSTGANINSALSSGTDGMTITLDGTVASPGSYAIETWVKFSNTKGATIICATLSQGACVVTHSGGVIHLFGTDTLSGTNTKLYRIAGLTFDAAAVNGVGIINFSDYFGATITTTSNIRIDHNFFINTVTGEVAISFGQGKGGQFYGVADHNLFSGANYFTSLIWNSNPPASWPSAQRGTANNFFFEDNTIIHTTNTSPGGQSCIDAWGPAAFVFRFNTSLNCLWGVHGVNHGGGPANIEFYNNTITLDSGAGGFGVDNCLHCFHHQGSGEVTAFNNIFDSYIGHGTSALAVQHYRDSASSEQTYTIIGQATGTSGEALGSSIRCSQFTPPYGAFTASRFTADFDHTGTNVAVKAAVYSDVAGTPTTKLGESSAVTITSDGRKEFTVNWTPAASTPYWLCVFGDGGSINIKYVAGGTSAVDATASYPTLPSTFTLSSTGTLKYGVWAAGTCDGTADIDVVSGWPGNRTPAATYRGYPCWHQPGRDFAGNLSPIYGWNNYWADDLTIVNLVMATVGTGSLIYFTEHFSQNRDWYTAVSLLANSNPTTPFDGTVGVGVGTLANRPTTCTPTSESADAGKGGVFYFAVDQGSWNGSGVTYQLGGTGTAYTSGLGYRCSATNTWVLDYTPYTYPHPLVDPTPYLTSITPDNGAQNSTVGITLAGTILDGASPSLAITPSTGITYNTLSCSATSCTANFVIASDATVSARTVTFTSSDGTSNSVTFTVTASGGPSLTSISPTQGYRGAVVPVTFNGAGLTGGTVTESCTGISFSGTVVVSSTLITSNATITDDASLAQCSLQITVGGNPSNAKTFQPLNQRGAPGGAAIF